MTRNLASLLAIALGLVAAVPAPQAQACGGFFCSRVPIDQSGENIAFEIGADGSVTAHIQILYTGPSESFAWILPVPSVPEIGVGTDVLFQELARTTAPQFTLDYRTDGTCRREPSCEWGYGYDSAYPSGSYRGGDAAAGAADAGAVGVEVLSTGNVGPYETAVLRADDGSALYTWLRDQGYDIPASAEPEIAYYTSTGHAFVALRLRKNVDAGEIQPVVLRYTSGEACIPLRLTRIAATADMPVTAYFLGSSGAMSINYPSVEPDLDDVGLWTGSSSYFEKVNAVVDEAGGRAFVNEYSGSVPPMSIALSFSIEDLRSVSTPKAFLQSLSGRLAGDNQLLGILERRIPPPAGVRAQDFFNCLANGWCTEYDDYLGSLAFDASGLVDDLTEAIVQPRADAQAMLARHPRLTRLFTSISPSEMTVDPMFMMSASVATRSNLHPATRVTECSSRYTVNDAPVRIDLPSGHSARVSEGRAFVGSDDTWCRSHYGVGAAGMPRVGGAARSPSRLTLCSASAAASTHESSAAGVVLGGLGLLALARIRRRSRR